MAANPAATTADLLRHLLITIIPAQDSIIRQLDSPTDYWNLRAGFGLAPFLTTRMFERLLSNPCQETITLQPIQICGQDSNASGNDYVRVRQCQGYHHYQAPALGHNYIPPRNASGRWPEPTKGPWNHPQRIYICKNCIDRDKPLLTIFMRRAMQQCHANFCKKHSTKPPYPGPYPYGCICSTIVNRTETTYTQNVGWRCKHCCHSVWLILQCRGSCWKQELRTTHRRKAKRRDRTIGVYRGALRAGFGTVCPITGCGRSSQTATKDPKMMTMCLACCGVFRAHDP